jgi:hypothetical protein
MTTDPTAPSNGTPPRTVEAWTQVAGHIVVANQRLPFCSCGDRAPNDWALSPREWRDEHLRGAWPVLVPKLDGESLEDWRSRLSDEYVKASAAEQELYDALGLGRSIPPGGAFPTITPEYADAGERVEVLQEQIEEVGRQIARGGPMSE